MNATTLPRLLTLASLLLGACAVDDAANPGARCSVSEDCPDGGTCYRGFCVAAEPQCDGDGTMVESCYTGPMGTLRVGECREGVQVCQDGVPSECLGQVLPAEMDVCNGLDEDCDGMVDEAAGQSCTVEGATGICAAGTSRCRGTVLDCVPSMEAVPETCNGMDDDCDGSTDEGTAVECYTGSSGCVRLEDGTYDCDGVCATGMQECTGGSLGECMGEVVPHASGLDDCGNGDENCNGMIDEDCMCTSGSSQDCYGGPAGTQGVGTCVPGMQECVDMSWGDCTGQTVPEPETCANMGEDNDCDGVDDDIAGLGDPCMDSEAMGVCRTGTLGCDDMGMLVCVTPDPAEMEACDGLDDNCDGMVDEGFDLLSDPANCGDCGVSCESGQMCCNGTCADTSSDEANCGGCGMSCGTGQTCMSGECCRMGETVCDGECVNTQTDPNNCGRCGNRCLTVGGALGDCDSGRCVL